MKITKKGKPIKGVCSCCKTEYLIGPRDLRRHKIFYTGKMYLRCKVCLESDVEVKFD